MAMRQSRQRVNLVIAFLCALLLLTFYRNRWSSSQWQQPPSSYLERTPNPTGDRDVELVVASQRKDNVTWLNDYLHDWHKSIYVVDDPTNPLTVAENKGREANVFLTYIIDRYDSLPGNIIFHRAERFQWHNDNPDYDALPLLQRFRFDYLRNEGYVNLRCVWILGCPVEIRPVKDEAPFKEMEPIHAKHIYRGAFEELFPELAVPEEVGVTCCSQFALRRETIWQRPRSDYVRYRDWLLNSPLEDQLSGRVLEYSWHSTSHHILLILPPTRIAQRLTRLTTTSDFWQKGCALP